MLWSEGCVLYFTVLNPEERLITWQDHLYPCHVRRSRTTK